jgi:hypothetical protein
MTVIKEIIDGLEVACPHKLYPCESVDIKAKAGVDCTYQRVPWNTDGWT